MNSTGWWAKQHDAGQEGEVDGDDQERHRSRHARPAAVAARQVVARSTQVTTRRVDHTASAAFQPKVRDHEGAVPAPGAGHHQHRRRGVRGERAADRDVDEQHAERAVLEPFGYAGPEYRGASIRAARVIAAGSVIREPSSGTSGQAEPAQATRCAPAPARAAMPTQRRVPAVQHRPGGGDDHHHEHEQRLGVLARLGILDAPSLPPAMRGDGEHQHDGPEAEDDLDFAEQVEQAGMARVAPGQPLDGLAAKV